MTDCILWRTPDQTRWFLFPKDTELPAGVLELAAADGCIACFDPARAALYEIDEREGRAWAQAELGAALDEARGRIDAKLADARACLDAARHAPVSPTSAVTPDAVPAIAALVKSLPALLRDGLSGEPARIAAATEAVGAIQTRLNAAGIAVGTGLEGFPTRLASLRDSVARQRREN